MKQTLSPYLHFNRKAWRALRQDMPLLLSEVEAQALRGQIDVVSLAEIETIYLPLSRLLSLYVTAHQELYRATAVFLGHQIPKVPYIIGVSGSVAVGKSTTSRVLKALLSRWSNHQRVSVITTDGFLLPLKELQKRRLMERKGFPESYDLPHLLRVLHDVKAGMQQVKVPVYSHHHYDIVPDQYEVIEEPDIVILEGLNILQTPAVSQEKSAVFVSDFLDFSVFVDAHSAQLATWFQQRVLQFWRGPFQAPDSYFHHLSLLTEAEVIAFADRVWREINEVNLLNNILPYRERAHLILR